MALLPHLPAGPLGHLAALKHDWLGLLQRVAQHCGDIGSFRIAHRTGVLLNHPRLAAQVLIQQAAEVEKGPLLTRLARSFMGDGLVTCPQAQHAEARALIQPAFAPRLLASHLPDLIEQSEEAAANAPAEVDVHAWLTRLSIALIGRALFSRDLPAETLEAAVHDGLHYINHRIRHPLGAPLWWPTALNRRAQHARSTLHSLVDELITRRRADPGAHSDLLAALLRTSLPTPALRDHLITLLLAGFETVAAHLAWTFALLATHPEVNARFLHEISTLPAQPSEADLDGLRFCRRILEESLRLHPPAHTLGRVTRSALELDGHAIAPGTVLIISPWLLHRRADLFPEPERFHPDRFETQSPRHALLPFGLGPRVCIGARFATLEALVVLVTLGRRLRFVPERPGLPAAETLLTLRPSGFRARIERL